MPCKPRPPRAYYIGAFVVGGPLLRVEILERFEAGAAFGIVSVPWPTYRLRVVSRSSGAYPFGDTFIRDALHIYDKARVIPGPRVVHEGKSWIDAFATYAEAKRQYDNTENRAAARKEARRKLGFSAE